MEEWKEYRLADICTKIGSGATPKGGKEAYLGGNTSLIRSQNVLDFSFSWDGLAYIDDDQAAKLNGVEIEGGDVLLNITGDSVARACVVPLSALPARVNQHVSIVRGDAAMVLNDYILYFLQYKKPYLLSLSQGGATRNALTKGMIEDLLIPLPPLSKQADIVHVLKSLDDKIEANKRINDNFVNAIIEVMLIWLLISLRNDNLEQQAMAIFDKMFPAIASGEDTIGSLITPKRGKGLLSKDAVEGNVPVVAGGLEPATYHNESNTIAPVVTISASGANAGYVNLWHIPVWSSDSSFIDATMSSNVYFWYVMLKKRQKEIFDAQTGSAQPHIYPKHIAEMPLGEFQQPDVEKFTEIVTPMFEIRGKNMKESERLASIRDTLLPKLMSGELKLENVNM